MIKELAEEARYRAEVPTDRAGIGYNAFRCWMTIGYRWLCSRTRRECLYKLLRQRFV